jgi:hypothetical protein
VTFQEGVHSSKTREADCDEQSTIKQLGRFAGLWFVPMDAAAASFTAVRRVEFDFQFDTHTKQFPAKSI